jgi:hypothetical protein
MPNEDQAKHLRLAAAQIHLTVMCFVFCSVSLFISCWYLPRLIAALNALAEAIEKLAGGT